MRISDWSSDVCSSDLLSSSEETRSDRFEALILSTAPYAVRFDSANRGHLLHEQQRETVPYRLYFDGALVDLAGDNEFFYPTRTPKRSEEHTSELQSLMRISYAVFCLKKKNNKNNKSKV